MALDANTPLTLNLNLEKINVILGALGSLSYDKVSTLIGEIHQQATRQLTELQSAQSVATLVQEANP